MLNKILLSLFCALLILSCGSTSNPDLAGGVETGNGIVAGVIVPTATGTTSFVEVLLVPETFNPVTGKLADSLKDTTDSSGSYEIKAPDGKYNIVARSLDGKSSAMISHLSLSGKRIEMPVPMDSSVTYTYHFTEKPMSDGQIGFEGTPFVASYTIGDSVVTIIGIPAGAVDTLPKIVIDAQPIVATVTKIVIGDGAFENFGSLYFDSVQNCFWAGTANDGLFRIGVTGTPVEHDTLSMLNSASEFVAGDNGLIYIAAGNRVFEYNGNNTNPFTEKLIGSSPVKGVALQGIFPVAAFQDKIKYFSRITIAIAGVTTMAESNDSLLVGTESGKIFVLTNSIRDSIVLPTIGSVKSIVNSEKSGQLFVAGDSGISLLTEKSVLETWSRFGVSGADSLVAMSSGTGGSLWVLTKGNRLFHLSSERVLSSVTGFEKSIPLQMTNEPFPAVDLTIDSAGSPWILFSNGALLRIQI